MFDKKISTRFDFLEEIGRGAQGVVYRAYDRVERRIVALKRMVPRSTASVLELKREFRAISHIRHPQLVQLYDLFVESDFAFFTMELIAGTDIVKYTRPAGQLDNHRIKRTFGQLFRGIEALHLARRIHRDLKPTNVMVEPDGRLVILDFGLVAPRDDLAMSLVDELGPAGTVPYMPPEAFDGHPTSPGWDWYALGAILYECLVGAPPFAGPISKIINEKKSVPIDRAELGEWSELVCRALEPDPGRRPEPEELEQAFEAKQQLFFPEPEFLGRETELEELAKMWALQGPRVATVSGLGGIGKTALISEFTRRSQLDGALIFMSRCRPNETVAFEILDGLVDGLSRTLDKDSVSAVLDPVDETALAKLFPVMRSVLRVLPPSTLSVDESPTQLRRRAARALRQLLTFLGRRNRLLVRIEDAQWASPDGAAFFNMVFGPGEPYEVMVVLSYRPERGSPMISDIEDWKQAWTQQGISWTDLPLSPLSDKIMETLVDAQLPRDTERETMNPWIFEQSGGNPYLVEELCRAVLTSDTSLVGEPLEQALLARINGLDPVLRDVLTCVALSGRALHRGVVIRCGQDQKVAERTLGELLASRFLRDVSSGDITAIDVYHDRVRDALEHWASGDVVKTSHSRLADALRDTNADPRELVSHLLAAKRLKEAAIEALEAARLSGERLEFDNEARFLRTALEHGDFATPIRRRYERDLAEALANAGRGEESAREWMQLSKVDHADSRYAERRAAALYLGSGHIDQGYSALDNVLHRVGLRLPKSPLQAQFAFGTLRARVALSGYRRHPPRDDTVLREYADVCWDASEMLSMVDTVRGGVFQARNMLASLRLGDPYRLARAFGIETAYLGAMGSPWPKCQRVSEMAIEAAREGGQHLGEALAIGGPAVAKYFHGKWKDALDDCEEADLIYRTRCVGVTWERDTTALFILMCLLRLGRLREARERAFKECESAEDRGDLFLEVYANIRILGPLLVAFNDANQAEQLVEDSMRRWSSQGYQVQEFWADYTRTLIALARGQSEKAESQALQTLANLKRARLQLLVEFRVEAIANIARACIRRAIDGHGRSLGRAKNCVRELSKTSVHWPHVYAEALRGCIDFVEGRRDKATTRLAAAADGFQQLEMPVDAAVAELVQGLLQSPADEDGRIKRAEQSLRDRGVVDPRAYANTLLPTSSV